MSSDQKRIRIPFTQAQIEWLERLYPEVTSQSTEQEMLYRAGQRSVLSRIKQESQVEVRLVPVNR
jgi:hypothetical protein